MRFSISAQTSTLTIALSVLLLGAIGCDSKPTVTPESRAERNESIQKAFIEEQPEAGDEVKAVAEVPGTKQVVTDDQSYRAPAEEVMKQLRVAFTEESASGLAKLIDAETMLKMTIEMGILPSDLGRGRQGQQFAGILERSLVQSLSAAGNMMKWDDTRVTRIEALGPDQMIVYVKLWDDEIESYSKMRWWLKQSSSGWRVYDFEDFDSNVRVSTMLGVGFAAAKSGGIDQWAGSLKKIVTFMQNQDNMVDMVLGLDQLKPEFETILNAQNVPAEVEGLARQLKATMHMMSDEWDESLAEIDEAQKIAPDAPGTIYLKMTILTQLERYEEAKKTLDEYVEILGWDADTYSCAAEIAYESGDADKAREYALLGLKDQPGSFYNLEYYVLALPEDQKSKVEEYFLKLSDQEAGFGYLMDSLLFFEDMAGAEALLEIQRKHNPDSELIEYYESEMEEESEEVEG